MYKIAKENLSALFQSAIAEESGIYICQFKKRSGKLQAWTEDANVSLETLKTVKSPKMPFSLRAKLCTPATERGKETEHRTAGTQRTELCSIRYESL